MNCCIDWMTYSLEVPSDYLTSERSPDYIYAADIAQFISKDADWQLGSGRYGFNEKLSFQGIEILFGGYEDRGLKNLVCINISGQGCRAWEELKGDIMSLLQWADNEAYNVSRMDIAIDDKDGKLDIDRLYEMSATRFNKQGFLNDKCYWWGATKVNTRMQGTDGCTLYYGSSKSDIRVRIYDKAAEQKISGHWVRVETVLRNDRARIALHKIVDTGQAGEVAAAILRNQLFFCPSLVQRLISRMQQGTHRNISATGGLISYRLPNRLS